MAGVELKSFGSAGALAEQAAWDWLAWVAQGQADSPSVAFSGGDIAAELFARAAALPSASALLGGAHYFWADERCVSPEDPQSNYGMAHRLLFKPLGIGADKIHRLRGELEPSEAVAQANAELKQLASGKAGAIPILDLVFLGMGKDGHVASLFPNAPSKIIEASDAFIFVDDSPKPPPQRISLSYKAIAAAKNVWVLVSGQGKESSLRQSLRAKNTSLGRVLQMREHTLIYHDQNI